MCPEVLTQIESPKKIMLLESRLWYFLLGQPRLALFCVHIFIDLIFSFFLGRGYRDSDADIISKWLKLLFKSSCIYIRP